MSQSVLASALATLQPTDTEATAVARLTDAYATFAADAIAGAIPITPAGVALGRAAMLPALTGISSPDAGATILVSATQAFWVAVVSGLSASFATATAIIPPPHAGLLSALLSVFAANVDSQASVDDALNAVAGAFFAQAIIGGTITVPPGTVLPIL